MGHPGPAKPVNSYNRASSRDRLAKLASSCPAASGHVCRSWVASGLNFQSKTPGVQLIAQNLTRRVYPVAQARVGLAQYSGDVDFVFTTESTQDAVDIGISPPVMDKHRLAKMALVRHANFLEDSLGGNISRVAGGGDAMEVDVREADSK